MKTFKIILLTLLLVGGAKQSKAQFDAIELIPGAVVPIFNDAQYYRPGWALYANYYYDDSPGYSLYGGLGAHQMYALNNESGYFPFVGLQFYYGGQLKFLFNNDLMDFAVGGELGWMLRLYAGNVFSGNTSIFLESSLGIAPKIAWHWRPGNSFFTLGVQCKYNGYFSLSGAFYGGTWADGVHQWLQPGVSFKFYL